MTDWAPASGVSALAGVFVGLSSGVNAPPPQALGYANAYTGNSVTCTPRAILALRQTRPWVRFIAVLLMIGGGFIALAGIIMAIGLLSQSSRGPTRNFEIIAFLGYVVAGILYAVPALLLNRYASRITDLLSFGREDNLEAALEAQKSFWKFVGILMLVVIGLYLLAIVVGVLIIGLR